MIANSVSYGKSKIRRKDNYCLLSPDKPRCKVIRCVGTNLLIVDFDAKLNCSERMSFGNVHVCIWEGRLTYYDNFGI